MCYVPTYSVFNMCIQRYDISSGSESWKSHFDKKNQDYIMIFQVRAVFVVNKEQDRNPK